MAASGHEEQFSPPALSARYVIRQETFAGMHGNGRDAPKPAIPRGIQQAGEFEPQTAGWREGGDYTVQPIPLRPASGGNV